MDIPSLELILLLSVRSGRSIVFATASTINRLYLPPGQLKKLYITPCPLVTSWSSSSISTTHGTRRGLGVENSLSSSPSAWVGLTRSPLMASHSSEYAWCGSVTFIPLISTNVKSSSSSSCTMCWSCEITSRTVAVLPVPGVPEM